MLRCFLASQELIAAVWSIFSNPQGAKSCHWNMVGSMQSMHISEHLCWIVSVVICHAQDPQASSVCASSECSCSQLNAGLTKWVKTFTPCEPLSNENMSFPAFGSTKYAPHGILQAEVQNCSSASHVGHS